ncbi:CsgE family curli-type amyloid fiber assembly protein [Parachitinimonas caeni]|uniref:Curli production assembly/transport component CsgE n=1 Tax=Parachitinimonas caeni TaxID=3031301 RepID=A0ABT7DYP7_9NEIS|nr:CsgE family curli-type amyloid fiber assembly protein [Parachitinimonas caeni]MDK2124944.1 CsgE family curli-type amyloid fiber assembly protein [Parachitinimonas caeni]
MRVRSAFLALSLALGISAAAKDELPPAEIGNLLLDRTFSAAGSAFAREFFLRWNALDVSGKFFLTIVEKPERRGGTRAWVELDGEAIVVIPLSPGRPAPAQAAVEAAFARALERSLSGPVDSLDVALPLDQKIE